jgi:hypothetical protein
MPLPDSVNSAGVYSLYRPLADNHGYLVITQFRATSFPVDLEGWHGYNMPVLFLHFRPIFLSYKKKYQI